MAVGLSHEWGGEGMASIVSAGVLPSLSEIRRYIRSTSTYAHLADVDILLEEVTFGKLQPLQILLAQRKLRRAHVIIEEHIIRDLPIFSPLVIGPDLARGFASSSAEMMQDDAHARISLPPIVEFHDGHYVIIDGHHRIFELYTNPLYERITSIHVIALSNVNVNFPASPVKLMGKWREQVHIDDEKYYARRDNRYNNFEPSWWRPIPVLRADGAIVNRTRADE